jgi:hypothetical protein
MKPARPEHKKQRQPLSFCSFCEWTLKEKGRTRDKKIRKNSTCQESLAGARLTVCLYRVTAPLPTCLPACLPACRPPCTPPTPVQTCSKSARLASTTHVSDCSCGCLLPFSSGSGAGSCHLLFKCFFTLSPFSPLNSLL